MEEDFTTIAPAPSGRRAAARELTPRERAKLRATAIRDNNGGDMDDGTDEFYIDRDIVPDGWDYEWKSHSIMGAVDPSHEVALRKRGWEPVPASRHPELMPTGYAGETILRKGMILMERPMELTEETRSLELRRARLQVRTKEEQLSAAPPGQFERSNKDNSLVRVKRGYEKVEIPE